MKQKRSRWLAALLTVAMMISIFPTSALAVDGDSNLAADLTTHLTWQEVFGGSTLSTKDIGRIWTDKSVYTEDSVTLSGDTTVQISKETDAEFLVELSALGSTVTITDQTAVPVDVMLVLDMSPKMQSSVNEMLTAANAALANILTSNPYNRVGVTVYDNTAATILPLDRYENYDNGGQTALLSLNNRTISSNGIKNGHTVSVPTFSFDSGTYRNYQVGLYTAMTALTQTADTTVEVDGQMLTRAPVVIAMSSGEPELAHTRFVNIVQDEDKIEAECVSNNDHSAHVAQTFMALMQAAYMKQQVTAHYYGNNPAHEAYIYTVAVGNLANDSNEELALAALNPSAQLESDPVVGANDTNLRDSLAAYNNGSVKLLRARGGLGIIEQHATIEKTDSQGISIEWDQLKYNDGFYQANNVASQEDWTEVFDQITDVVNTAAPTYPTASGEGASGTGGDNGALTFTDQLGSFMKVTGTPTVIFSGEEFHVTGSNTTGDITSYTFEGAVDTPVYGQTNVNKLTLTVKTNTDGSQTLTWTIPAELVPLRAIEAKTEVDGNGQETYSIAEASNGNAYPIRLFYSVKQDDTAALSTDDKNDYYAAHSKDGKTDYYAGAWDAESAPNGSTTAVFTPASTNSFYYYTENTALYVLHSNNGSYLTDAAAAGKTDLVPPGQETITVNGVQYKLERATGYVAGRAYYYIHSYYQANGSGNSASYLTDYHRVTNGAALANHTETIGGNLYIKAGTTKMSRVSDMAAAKEENKTGTSANYRVPEFELDGKQVTVDLGNNGRMQKATPTGDLTVQLNETTGADANADDVKNKTFTYTLELYNSEKNSYSSLSGSYPIQVTGSDGAVISTDTIQDKGTFMLQAGQKAVISGLPAGSVFRISQEAESGYTPTYTSLDTQVNAAGGIRWRVGTGETVPRGEINVTNAYDVSQQSFDLRYNANAQNGGHVTGMPNDSGAQSGGDITLSTQQPSHSVVSEKKVVFLGWSESKTSQIYGKDDKTEYAAIQNSIYAAGAEFHLTADTDLYAVWGYDENGDGNPDVTENSYTLTYNANGGTFGAETEKTVSVLAQTGYPLDYSDGNRPTHEKDNGTNVAFVTWSETQTNHIYSFGDSEPLTRAETVDISGNKEVYAVWGYDSDGDGIPDISEVSHSITASASQNGSIDPSGKVSVMEGQNKTFAITPDQGYAVDTVIVQTIDTHGAATTTARYVNRTGTQLPAGCTWTSWAFSNVVTDYKITVSFAESKDGVMPDRYNRTLTYDANGGTGAPAVQTGLNDGQRYVLSTQEPMHDTVQLNGTETTVLFVGWTMTDDNERIYQAGDTMPATITSVVPNGNDVTVFAVWGYDTDGNGVPDVKEHSWHVTASSDGNGTVSPTDVYVLNSDAQVFLIKADPGYALATVSVDGTVAYQNDDPQQPFAGNWTLENVTTDHVITVAFLEDGDGDGIPDAFDPDAGKYQVTVVGGSGSGAYAPDEVVTITADAAPAGQEFDCWISQDGITLDDAASAQTTFKMPDHNVTVTATYKDASSSVTRYTITASAGQGGSISPSGSVRVRSGSDKTFTITAEKGYVISDVLVDGTSVGAVEQYTFESVHKRHTIEAIFEAESEIADPDDTGVSHWLNTKDHNAYLNGYTDGTFGPNQNMTRAEVAQMFYNLLLDQNVSAGASFTDVASDAWYADAVHTLSAMGIIQGVGNSQFAPDRAITRAEFTVIAMRFAELDTSGQNIFSDVNTTDWFYDQVVGSIQYGWITGYSDGTFRPNNTITRAEVTTITNRMLGRIADTQYVDGHADSLRHFSDVTGSHWAYYHVMEAANTHDYEKSGSQEIWKD